MNIFTILTLTLTPLNILIIVIGVVLGVAFGALPGFTASMGVAVLIPITYGMSPVGGLVLLASVYCGAVYGGSISAILLHTPGTPASAMTAIDGYEMTKKGRAGEALNEAAIASFWGGILSVSALIFMAPPLAEASLRFGPQENFMLAIFGLSIISSLVGKSLLKGLIGGVFGLLVGTVGIDPIVGKARFVFGINEFYSGIQLVPALIGLFSITQVFALIISKKDMILEVDVAKVTKRKLKLKELLGYPWIYLKSSVIGTIVGILPGAGTSIASFLAYNNAKNASKHPEEFGNGSREAIAASESGNNAVTGGSMIPMLTLGIPGNSVTAILMGGLMIQGLYPGYALFTERADIVYPFIWGMFFSNFVMLFIGLVAAKYFIKLVNTPVHILAVVILVLGVLGSYAINASIVDVYVMFAFGLIGFFMKRFDFDTAPVVLGIILGPIADKGLYQSIQLARGGSVVLSIITRPICILLLLMTIFSILGPVAKEKGWLKKVSLRRSK